MKHRRLVFPLLLALCLAACDETDPHHGSMDLDAGENDGPLSEPDTNGQADAADGQTLGDAAPVTDMLVPDMGAIDECATDNGGCGNAELWRCTDRPDASPECTLIPDNDFTALTAGVETLFWGGALPDSLVIHGGNAFPVAVDANGRAMVGAGRLGSGRFVHVTHESLMSGQSDGDGEGDGYQFFENSVRWLAADRGMNVLLEQGLRHLRESLEGLGYSVGALEEADLDENTAVVLLSSYGPFEADFKERLTEYIRNGGGLFSGGHAWWFAQSTGQDPATQYPGNAILDPIGVVIAGLGDIQGNQTSIPATPPAPVFHARSALNAIRAHIVEGIVLEPDFLEDASETVAHAIRVLPADHPYFGAVLALAEAQPIQAPTADQPLRPADDPINALLVKLQVRIAQTAPANALPTIDAASDFPGDASDAQPVIREITVNGNYRGRNARYAYSAPRKAVWRSTGLYARPGAAITIEFAQPVGPGLSVLVGCHTDDLWNKEEWQRYPSITRAWPITQQSTIVGNAFGGPIYIRFSPGSEFGPMTATITGAIQMPIFRLGQTTARQWQDDIREYPAPWAEFASEKIVVTLPSDTIRAVDDPTPAIEFWSSVMDLAADLAAVDRERARPERFVLDRQISAGSLHSGYPIMGHLPSAADFINIERVRAEGSWGPFHEIGHNHQLRDWVLPGTTEANVNLWSVYISEVGLNISRDIAHSALAPDRRAERMQRYLDEGARFAQWNVWTALETYLQLQSAFGWQFYQDLFEEYLDIPNARAPREDVDRIDEWVIRSSQRAGVNLIPFYRTWGFPIGERVINAVGELAEWLEDPMNPR